MPLIQNFDALASSSERKTILEIVESGLLSIQPEEVLSKNVRLENEILHINNDSYNLADFENIYLIGFGKGSARNSKIIEGILEQRLTEGYVIDTIGEEFKRIEFTQGTHPVISQQNVEFTQKVMDRFSRLTEKALVIVVICGGGSAMFEHPHSVTLEQKIAVEKSLLKSGATIIEMNKIRQHLSDVKGGGLAQILYPATVASLIFSDVPGNDITYIASGPTVKNPSTIDDAMELIKSFQIPDVPREAFIDNPHDDKYFERVKNHIVLSNLTALNAMLEKAKTLGINARIETATLQGDANETAKTMIEKVNNGQMLLAGGETTVTVHGNGKGGRNQQFALFALTSLPENTTVVSINSDGWDNSPHAGAIVDILSVEKARQQNLYPKEFLDNNDSFTFFERVGDGIVTDRLPSNVADLLLIWKRG